MNEVAVWNLIPSPEEQHKSADSPYGEKKTIFNDPMSLLFA